jgi:hypothetical protein
MPRSTDGSIVYPEVNSPEIRSTGKFNPVKLPDDCPELSEESRICIQSFADATGVSADRVASDAILYWWDNDGADIVLRLQQRKAKSQSI